MMASLELMIETRDILRVLGAAGNDPPGQSKSFEILFQS